MLDGTLVCWIIAAVVLPGILLGLLLISLALGARCHSSNEAIRVDLDKLIRASNAHGVLHGEGVYRTKKHYEESPEETAKENLDSSLVMVG